MATDSTAQRLLPHLRRVVLARDADTTDGQLLGAFVASRDEAAFATLVRRHGPMVLGVCRRVVGDPHLAEDAFQATFLVLARRAAVVRPRHLVGHWLYGVAYRTALKARGAAARRHAKEKQVDAMPQPPVSADQVWADLQPVLDAELARLPEKYRIPIVLCDLNGRPQRDVARELKLPAATLANRLGAARRLLAKRLTARGVALSASAIAAALSWHAATSAVSPALANATVKAACATAAGAAVGLPVPVVQLSEGVMRMFVLSKLKAAAAGIATCLVALAGLGLLAGPSLRANPDDRPVKVPVTADPARPTDPQRAADSEDLAFLRQRSLDLRGTLPTPLEVRYFLTDKDERKRGKVTNWMLEEHGSQKLTAQCARCHTAAPDHGFSAHWHQAHPHAEHPSPTFQHLAEWMTRKSPPAAGTAKTATAQVEVDKSESDLAVARLALQLAEADAKAGKEDPAQSHARIHNARAAVARAEALLKNADTDLTETEKHARMAIWRLRLAAHQQESNTVYMERLLRDYNSVLAEKSGNTDLEFLRRVSQDLRGTPPTRVEENYFLADKDPKKREKLLELMAGKSKGTTGRDKLIDELLADPEVQKRWTLLWQERLAADRRVALQQLGERLKSPPDRLGRLLSELLDAKRADEQILDAICLATMARFPSDAEKKLILEALKGQPDRRAAWNLVVAALASTQEAKAHAEALAKRVQK